MVVRKAAKLEKELHRAIIVLFDFDKHITLRNVRTFGRAAPVATLLFILALEIVYQFIQ